MIYKRTKSIISIWVLLIGLVISVTGVVSALTPSTTPLIINIGIDPIGSKTVGDDIVVTGMLTAEDISKFGKVWDINFDTYRDRPSSSAYSSYETEAPLKTIGKYTFGPAGTLSYTIPTAGLAPGRYAVEVSASIREGNSERTRSYRAMFDLVSPGQATPTLTPTPAPSTPPATPSPAVTTANSTPASTQAAGFAAVLCLIGLGGAAVLVRRR